MFTSRTCSYIFLNHKNQYYRVKNTTQVTMGSCLSCVISLFSFQDLEVSANSKEFSTSLGKGRKEWEVRESVQDIYLK